MPVLNTAEKVLEFVRTVVFITFFLLYNLISKTMRRNDRLTMPENPENVAESSRMALRRQEAARARAPLPTRTVAAAQSACSMTWRAEESTSSRAGLAQVASLARSSMGSQSTESVSSQLSDKYWNSFPKFDNVMEQDNAGEEVIEEQKVADMLIDDPITMDLVTDDEFPKAIPAHRRATTTVQRQDSDNTLVDPDSQGENRNRNTLKVGSKRSIAAVDSRAEPGPALKKRTSIITPVILQPIASTSKAVAAPIIDEPSPFRQGPAAPPVPAPSGIVFIAPHLSHQGYIDKLSWGTAWELARLLSNGHLSKQDIEDQPVEIFKKLRGPSAKMAPKVVEAFASKLRRTRSDDVPDPLSEDFFPSLGLKAGRVFAELDREDEALRTRSGENLGCNNGVVNDWHGGKVQQVARVVTKLAFDGDGTAPSYSLRLEKQAMGRSHRISRFYGSRRVIQVTIPKTIFNSFNNGLYGYFINNAFVIFGRVFRAVFAKDRHVYLVETNEDYKRKALDNPIDQDRLSLHEFINWHNDICHNLHQPMAKWASRFALALSTSEPVLRFSTFDPTALKDIVADGAEEGKKPAAKYVFTDGAGFMNRSAAEAIAKKMGWSTIPSVIQMRICGAKGILLLHPDDKSDHPMIWLRDSQVKIKVLSPDHSQLTVDLVRPPLFAYPAKLSAEIIVNLGHNGVPHDIFVRLMREGLDKEVKRLTSWVGNHSMQRLWDAIFTTQGVFGSRMRQLLGAASRAHGFGENESDDGLDIEGDEDDDDEPVAWSTDEVSGLPSTLAEAVLAFLAAGFHPEACPPLMDKLKYLVKQTIEAYVLRYKITAPLSCTAFVAPDPLEILKEGEIFCRMSRPYEVDGVERDVIIGPVLVTRHPCKVPSDVQKVMAVDCHDLYDYKDVILFSVHGSRSLASMLGGGDYDGDTITIIWQPEIVAQFQNADPKYADPPPGHADAFIKDDLSAKDFWAQNCHLSELERSKKMQAFLLAALTDTSLVGQYSNRHDIAVYRKGYSSEEAWRLAYMFCETMDGAKSGLRVKPEILKADRQKYSRWRKPSWKESEEEKERAHKQGNSNPPKRPSKLSDFVMDVIKAAGAKAQDHHLSEFSKLPMKKAPDADLTRPFFEAHKRAALLRDDYGEPGLMDELEMMQAVVDSNAKKYDESLGGSRNVQDSPKGPRPQSPAKVRNVERQQVVRGLSSAFHRELSKRNPLRVGQEEFKWIAASYAYIVASETIRRPLYAFEVAFRELCKIKTSNLGAMPITSAFYNAFAIHKGVIRAFPEVGEDENEYI